MSRWYDFYVYIMASESRTLYIGFTNGLERRVSEHKQDLIEGFTKQYGCHKLVYYEHYTDVKVAIAREKQLKRWRREKKVKLIESVNPTWRDLSEDWNERNSEIPRLPPRLGRLRRPRSGSARDDN